MDVSFIEYVLIEVKFGDLIGHQLIQIAEQKASFHLIIFVLVIEMVLTHSDMDRCTCGLGICAASIL